MSRRSLPFLLLLALAACGPDLASQLPGPGLVVLADGGVPDAGAAPTHSADAVAFVVQNLYAESLFSVAVQLIDPAGRAVGAPTQLLTDHRLGYSKAWSSGWDRAVSVPPGYRFEVTFGAMSLGERKTFSALKGDPDEAIRTKAFLLFYDWDTARAAFTVSYGWLRDGATPPAPL